MKKILLTITLLLSAGMVFAETKSVASPNGQLTVTINNEGGLLTYAVQYAGKQMLEPSQLGLTANAGNFATGLTLTSAEEKRIDQHYQLRTAKASAIHYVANELNLNCMNADKKQMTVTFRVSDNDIAFRYSFPQTGERACMIIDGEATAFKLPAHTTTFICPQSKAMVGWMRTKPSYEEEYTPDAALNAKSRYGEGYTFPCLFRVGNDGWLLISETGTGANYAGCHLSDYSPSRGYQIAFPMPGEADGWGTTTAGIALPGETPWRTITVGTTLKPIVETTVAYDVVEERYPASQQYKPGRYTWSWIIWQDRATVYDDQVKFIDLAAAMGYEYCLVDALWDVQIGYDKLEELSRYAQSKGVSLLLWYNSNGFANDAPQGPKNCMNSAVARKREMAWMKKIGVKGIKVDFFGGDKQHTMQLYEDILSDANDYGIQVIFHGCTLPRGWERMYPNFVASEAVLASENVYFSAHHAEREAFELTMHPFCRNTVAAMDWGGTMMNRYMSRDNKSRHQRLTTNVFEMTAALMNQTSMQGIAICPNNLEDLSQTELDFLKQVPTVWDETRYIDGYPGRYAVLARRTGSYWFVTGMNAEKQPLKLTLQLPMLAGQTVDYYTDEKGQTVLKQLKIGKNGQAKIVIQPNGGIILKNTSR